MNNELKIMWLVRDKLQSVIDENYTLYNTVSKEYLEVTEGNINGMINMILEQLGGHGIKHLQFIKQEHSKVHFTTSITNFYNETNKVKSKAIKELEQQDKLIDDDISYI